MCYLSPSKWNVEFCLGRWVTKLAAKKTCEHSDLRNPIQHFFCITEELISYFGWINAIFIGWLDQFVNSSAMTEGQTEDWTRFMSKNSSCIWSSSQHEFSSLIRAQSRLLFGKFFWDEMMRLVCWFGSHLSFRIITDLPLPILHLEPKITTCLAFKMLC